MRTTREEREAPADWIRGLLADEEQMLKLLLRSGGLGRAALRLAQAQLLASGQPGRQPTVGELKLAARVIAARTQRDPELSIMPAQSWESRPSEPSGAPAAPLPPSQRAAGYR